MKTRKYRLLLMVAMLAGSLFAFNSCSDDDENNRQPDRIFRPTGISGESEGNSILLEWNTVPNAKSYNIEYSTDETFETDVNLIEVTGGRVGKYNIENLEYYTDYYFRISATSAVEGMDDSQVYILKKAIRTAQAPNILQPVTDKGDDWFTVTWNDIEGITVGTIHVVSDDEVYDETFTAADHPAKSFKLENLDPKAYVITAYDINGAKLNAQQVNLLAPIYPVAGVDIAAESATLRWRTGFNVTKIVLTPQEGGVPIVETIDDSGSKLVSGLTALTWYTATIYKGTDALNSVNFRTWHEIPAGATSVTGGDDLQAAITTAADGATLVLADGTYTSSTAGADVITLGDKSITLMTTSPGAAAIIQAKGFEIVSENNAVDAIKIIGIELDGSTGSGGYAFDHAKPSGVSVNNTVTTLYVADCYIHDFANSLLRANRWAAVSGVSNFTVDNCVVENVIGGNGFIATRVGETPGAGFGGNITITNSTLNMSGSTNRFIDMQLGNASTVVTIENNTIYGYNAGQNLIDSRKSDPNNDGTFNINRNIFYFGAPEGTSTAVKDIRVGSTSTFNISANNLRFDFASAGTLDKTWSDYTTTRENPGFKDAPNGDFTLSSQALIDAKVGDPRWR